MPRTSHAYPVVLQHDVVEVGTGGGGVGELAMVPFVGWVLGGGYKDRSSRRGGVFVELTADGVEVEPQFSRQMRRFRNSSTCSSVSVEPDSFAIDSA